MYHAHGKEKSVEYESFEMGRGAAVPADRQELTKAFGKALVSTNFLIVSDHRKPERLEAIDFDGREPIRKVSTSADGFEEMPRGSSHIALPTGPSLIEAWATGAGSCIDADIDFLQFLGGVKIVLSFEKLRTICLAACLGEELDLQGDVHSRLLNEDARGKELLEAEVIHGRSFLQQRLRAHADGISSTEFLRGFLKKKNNFKKEIRNGSSELVRRDVAQRREAHQRGFIGKAKALFTRSKKEAKRQQ